MSPATSDYPFYTFPARLERIVDGDTQHVTLDLGFHTTQRRDLRLLDVDTAEIYGTSKDSPEYKAGEDQKRFVTGWYDTAAETWANSHPDDGWPLAVSSHTTGDFGRYLATVARRSDGQTLNRALLDEYGDAVRYDP